MPEVTFIGNSLTAPLWAGDWLSRDHLIPAPLLIDHTQFSDGAGVRVVSNGGAAANATALPVAALPHALKNGTVLSFGAAGSKKFAKLTADAALGATSLTVEALPTAIADGDVAVFSQYGRKFISDGTLLGRTYAERDAGTGFGPAVDTDDEIFILAFPIPDATIEPYGTGVRPNTVIKENYLPDWTTISANANLLAKLRSTFRCIKGKD